MKAGYGGDLIAEFKEGALGFLLRALESLSLKFFSAP